MSSVHRLFSLLLPWSCGSDVWLKGGKAEAQTKDAESALATAPRPMRRGVLDGDDECDPPNPLLSKTA